VPEIFSQVPTLPADFTAAAEPMTGEFLLRFLFSCLVDATVCDASTAFQLARQATPGRGTVLNLSTGMCPAHRWNVLDGAPVLESLGKRLLLLAELLSCRGVVDLDPIAVRGNQAVFSASWPGTATGAGQSGGAPWPYCLFSSASVGSWFMLVSSVRGRAARHRAATPKLTAHFGMV
jgi:hypothetical protein